MRLKALLPAAMFVACMAAAPATQPTTPTPVDQISWMVGNWTIDTHWLSEGKEVDILKGRDAITWGPGKKFILADTILPLPDGKEYTRYHQIFSSEAGQLIGTSYVYDGTIARYVYSVDGPFIRNEHEMDGADGKPSGMSIDVLTGFLSDDESSAYGRPVGVAIDKRGALLVADDVGNVIWRVTAR